MLFLELVCARGGIRIPAVPELLDEALLLFFGGQFLEDPFFVRRDDINDVFFQPFVIRLGP